MIATTGAVLRNAEGDYEFEGKKFPSVTTILGTIEDVGLDKGLGFIFGSWTAKEACKIIESHLGGNDFMRPAGWVRDGDSYVKAYEPLSVAEWLLSGNLQKHLSKVGMRELNCAADRGTLTHFAVGCLLEGMDVSGSDVIAQYSDGLWPDDLAEGCIDALVAWWNTVDIKPIAHEISGLNTTLGYGGTIDLVAKINDEPYLIDFKTSEDWRISHLLQMSAYRAMDIWLEKDGDKLLPVPAHPIVADLPCLVILVRPESVTPYRIESETADKWFGQFKKLFDLKQGWSKAGQAKRLPQIQWKAFN